MRLLLSALMAFVATASAQPRAAPEPLSKARTLIPGSECPNATSQMAGRGSAWRAEPLVPKKLTELPAADAYAAIYQLDAEGCMVPVMYRDVRAVR